MREIKFRAWNGKKMYELGRLDLPWHEDIKIMQFTGLHDKNGVEVYEGDVVTAKYCTEGNKEHNLKGIVVWGDGFVGWAVEDHKMQYRMSATNGQREVIGNIYKNPELLEG